MAQSRKDPLKVMENWKSHRKSAENQKKVLCENRKNWKKMCKTENQLLKLQKTGEAQTAEEDGNRAGKMCKS